MAYDKKRAEWAFTQCKKKWYLRFFAKGVIKICEAILYVSRNLIVVDSKTASETREEYYNYKADVAFFKSIIYT